MQPEIITHAPSPTAAANESDSCGFAMALLKISRNHFALSCREDAWIGTLVTLQTHIETLLKTESQSKKWALLNLIRLLFVTVESWHCTLHAVVVVVLVVLVVFVLNFIRFLATNDCQAEKSFGERQRGKIITWLQWLTKSMSYVRSASVIQSLQYGNDIVILTDHSSVLVFIIVFEKKTNYCLWQGTRTKRHYFTSWCAKMASFAEQRSGASRFFIKRWIRFCGVWFLQPPYWSQGLSIETYPLVLLRHEG